MNGVTLATFRQYRPGATKADLRTISDDDLQRIYRDGYWHPVEGEYLQHGVDLAVFDLAVNSGVSRAARMLQKVVKVKQDGKVGPVTVTAQANLRGDDVVKAICASRMSFLRGLRHWSTFGRGWSRRVADIEARGVAMWLKVNSTAGSTTFALVDESDKAHARSQSTGKAAAGTAVGGAGGTAAIGVEIDPTMMIIGAAAVALTVIWMVVRSRHDRDRAEAYSRAAYEIKAERQQ